jgi:polyhydroxyalkanoate synthesis repressor PhaR
MDRLIKRYDNRKLYDTEAKQYVSLEELAALVRQGDHIQVVDNSTGEDLTVQTLARIIMEEGRSGKARVSTEFLHDMVRWGGKVVSTSREQLEKMVQASIEKLGPVRQAREELAALKAQVAELEERIAALSAEGAPATKTAEREES